MNKRYKDNESLLLFLRFRCVLFGKKCIFAPNKIANHSIAVLAHAKNEESLDNAEQPHHLTGGYCASKGRGNREGHRKKPPFARR